MEGQWVFGYGSLIWNPGFEFVEKRLATVFGFRRSFCQASHDHRGTPSEPGRVVTLEPSINVECVGMAFRLAEPSVEVLNLLDVREQDGYKRQNVDMSFQDGSKSTATTWIAAAGNRSWRGGESIDEVANVIARSSGPSGSNREYLHKLEGALSDFGIEDSYVCLLSLYVRRMSAR